MLPVAETHTDGYVAAVAGRMGAPETDMVDRVAFAYPDTDIHCYTQRLSPILEQHSNREVSAHQCFPMNWRQSMCLPSLKLRLLPSKPPPSP